jgi:hypothetical protein
MTKFTPALTLVVCLAGLSAARAEEISKPLGKWERKIGKSVVTLIVDENRLHATFVGEKACTLHADYAMTRDGVIYGVVTSIECDDDEDSAKVLFDVPFSCRFRIDEGALIVHDLKCHEVDSKDDVWNGRFKVVSPSPSRGGVVPTSYAPTPYSQPYGCGSGLSSPPYGSNGIAPTPTSGTSSSSSAPTATQGFQFWTGSFTR